MLADFSAKGCSKYQLLWCAGSIATNPILGDFEGIFHVSIATVPLIKYWKIFHSASSPYRQYMGFEIYAIQNNIVTQRTGLHTLYIFQSPYTEQYGTAKLEKDWIMEVL